MAFTTETQNAKETTCQYQLTMIPEFQESGETTNKIVQFDDRTNIQETLEEDISLKQL